MDGKRSKSSPTSAETIAGNDDLLTEGILLRLPAKSLVRFQLVCKHWKSLIYSPSFCRVHTRRLIHSGGGGAFILSPSVGDILYINPTVKAIHRFPLVNDEDHPHTNAKILQSRNGLWLIELDGGKNYSVHNPTTKQSRVLKFVRPRADGGDTRAICLGFDPSRSIHYKVFFVHLMDYGEETKFRVDVYDSETGEWTSIDYYPSAHYARPEYFDWIYLNNKLYSMLKYGHQKSSFLELQSGNIVRVPKIDVTDKRGVVEEYLCDLTSFYYFTGSNGRLHCAVTTKEYLLMLFELMEDNSVWLQLCKVDIDGILGVYSRTQKVGVIDGVNDHETDRGHVLLRIEGMVISYRFRDGHSEVVLVAPHFGRNQIFPFIESLAPV